MNILIWFSLFCALSWSDFQVPSLTAPVVDDAGIVSASLTDDLNSALKKIQQQGGPQINVLTVKTMDNLTIEEAAIKVAKSWGLGTAEKDNGILLMVAQQERKVRIEVGQALEGDLTDAYSRRIIDNDIVPAFRSGDYGAGIAGGVRGILLRMNPPLHLEDFLNTKFVQRPQTNFKKYKSLALIILFLLIFGFNSAAGGGGFGGSARRAGMIGGMLGGGFGGGFGSRGGFGSGGGWSGGGGGFSGGGSSGSW